MLKVLYRAYERISNEGEDFAQKLSKSLAAKYGIIRFEDLNIQNMVKDPIYAKGIMDASWNKLVTYTTYKA
jgi:putative transposase